MASSFIRIRNESPSESQSLIVAQGHPRRPRNGHDAKETGLIVTCIKVEDPCSHGTASWESRFPGTVQPRIRVVNSVVCVRGVESSRFQRSGKSYSVFRPPTHTDHNNADQLCVCLMADSRTAGYMLLLTRGYGNRHATQVFPFRYAAVEIEAGGAINVSRWTD